MEATINLPNITPVENTEESVEKSESPISATIIETSEKPREHVRTPALKRHEARLLMTASAAIGAATGIKLVLEASSTAVVQTFSASFAESFIRQALLCGIFLAAEFVLGFFAFGDYLVWTMPFLCAAGTVIRISADPPKLLAGGLLCLGAVIFGAAYSADMSRLLLRLSRGGTVHMETCPRRSYALEFTGCLVAALFGSLLISLLG